MNKAAPHAKQQIDIAAKRAKGNPLWVGVSVVAGALCFLPIFGGAVGGIISHMGDRVANSGRAHDEIKLRADYYRNVVAQKLGMDPAKVGVKEFLTVARGDPTFGKVVKDIYDKRDNENRESALINTGVAVAGAVPIPGLGGVAHLAAEASKVAKVGAHAVDLLKPGLGMLAGSKAASLFNKEKLVAQDVVERIDQCLLDAQQTGQPMKGAVTPQLVFLLRVAQDEAFAEEIKNQCGKPYQKLSPEQQVQVMQAYPALANAATSEAYAVSNAMLTPQDLAAKTPNLNSNANRYAVGAQNSSFVDTLRMQRAQSAANSSQALAT